MINCFYAVVNMSFVKGRARVLWCTSRSLPVIAANAISDTKRWIGRELKQSAQTQCRQRKQGISSRGRKEVVTGRGSLPKIDQKERSYTTKSVSNCFHAVGMF